MNIGRAALVEGTNNPKRREYYLGRDEMFSKPYKASLMIHTI